MTRDVVVTVACRHCGSYDQTINVDVDRSPVRELFRLIPVCGACGQTTFSLTVKRSALAPDRRDCTCAMRSVYGALFGVPSSHAKSCPVRKG